MERQEVTIGRDGKFKVETERYPAVSALHAQIVRDDNGIFIEDLNSRNGTFVNGLQVVRKRVTQNDDIFLAGKDYYRVDLEKVLEEMPMGESEYKAAFVDLRLVYENYTAQIEDLEEQMQRSGRIATMLPMSLLGGISGAIGALLGNTPNGKIYAVIIGVVLSVGALFWGANMGATKNKQTKRKLRFLREDFREAWCCPNCGVEFGTQNSWEYINRKGECPKCHKKWQVQPSILSPQHPVLKQKTDSKSQ